MKKFISVSLILVGIALIATVVVWYLLQGLFAESTTEESEKTNITNFIKEKVTGDSSESDESVTEVKSDISLGGLTLTPEQQQAAESMGINLEALTITDAVIDCAMEHLSQERIDAILAGEPPTFLEALTLVPCLKN